VLSRLCRLAARGIDYSPPRPIVWSDSESGSEVKDEDVASSGGNQVDEDGGSRQSEEEDREEEQEEDEESAEVSDEESSSGEESVPPQPKKKARSTPRATKHVKVTPARGKNAKARSGATPKSLRGNGSGRRSK